jgi:hypothetical protein
MGILLLGVGCAVARQAFGDRSLHQTAVVPGRFAALALLTAFSQFAD